MESTLSPLIPDDENEMIKDLYSYDILDAAEDKEFEELFDLASDITDCPVAAVCFINNDRQWVKAKKGIDQKLIEKIAAFTHSVFHDDVLIIEDAANDERFINLVESTSRIEFYAGVPVFSSKNKKLGVFCVMDYAKRKVTTSQLAALRLLSKQVSALLDARLRNTFFQQFSKKAILNNEQAYESFFNLAGVPKWIYDLDSLKFLQVNQAAIDKYGYSRDQFLQMSVYDIRSDEEKKNIHHLVHSMKEEEKTWSFVSQHRKQNGSIVDVEVTITDVLYMGKEARLATILDITEKVELKKQIEQGKDQLSISMQAAASIAREEERDHIGKELHDNINQILAAAKLYLDVADIYENLSGEMIAKCRENIIEAIHQVRQLSHSLVTTKDENFNLTTSILGLIEGFHMSGKFKINFSSSGKVETLPEDLKLNLFRIIQEQLTNIEKHAGASEVWLTIETDGMVSLRIEDDGKGFDSRLKKVGIGLHNMRQRAEIYKGTSSVYSRPGKGTVLHVEIPLDVIKA